MIYSFKDVKAGQVIGPVDVVIIGSGAGGGVMAHYLSKAGLKVVVLEKGGHFPVEELGRKEVGMLTRIQAMTIFTPATGKHTRVSMIKGECLGGGTVASESVTWDLPEVVKDDWVKMGLTSYGRQNPKMEEYRVELNKLLNVGPVPMNHHNPCNQILKIGAEREGIKWKSVDRPVEYCMRCGNCTQGCRYGVKLDSLTVFLEQAQKNGCDAYCGAEVDRVKINFPDQDDQPYRDKLQGLQGNAKEDALRELKNREQGQPAKFTVFAAVTDRKAPVPRDLKIEKKGLVVHARQVVMAAGPPASSRILMKSNINPNSVVGKKFTTHPTSFNVGRFDKSINLNGWDGINDSIEVHHFSDMFRNESYYDPARHGFLLEGALSLPWGIANLLPGSGKEHLALMADMNHMAGIEVNVKTDQYGTITPSDVVFDMSERDNEAMLYGTWITARIFFRAGAKQVFTGLPGLVLDSPGELDKIFKYKRNGAKGFLQKQANLYSGHHFGGLIMGTDPKTSFADETGECHEIKGLWVADGSAFPTNVGVNCALSIMTVARKIADDFTAKTKSV
jgi:choline dehydrogenase-like flavoprotein